MRVYKREYRNLKPETKRKISETMKNRKMPDDTKRRISNSMKKYWSNVAWEGEK